MSIGNITGRILVPVVVAIVFALSRRYLPSSSTTAFSETEASGFSKLQWRVGLAMLCVAVVFGLISYNMLVWTNRYLAVGAKANFVILPDHWMWFFLPVFGAISLSWEITLRGWMLIGDESRALKFESWSNSKAAFNATRVLRILIIVIELPIAIATVLALPIHTSISDAGLRIGHFGTLRTTDQVFSDVRGITVTDGLRLRDGSLQKRPAIVLEFSDGTRWSSADNSDPGHSVDVPLLSLLREKTKVPVAHVEAFPFGSV